jgi:hypothetical protein
MKDITWPKAKERRDMLRASGRCINSTTTGRPSRFGVEHGPVVRGGKCARCVAVHAGKAEPAYRRTA